MSREGRGAGREAEGRRTRRRGVCGDARSCDGCRLARLVALQSHLHRLSVTVGTGGDRTSSAGEREPAFSPSFPFPSHPVPTTPPDFIPQACL